MVYGVRFNSTAKYRNQRQNYGGYNYMSKKEANYAYYLDMRLKAKEIKGWERQKRIRLYAYGKHITDYIIDFVVTHKDDSVEYVEVKGFATDVWKIKWALFEAQMAEQEPGATLTVER